ncbi:PilZ domain-containing protein [Tepidicella baoligensis]|uniref:PilZ domain-containing protein n=1 Tax=Tepidicella baoligensis TaxID=2707016 RepID=UPI0015DA8078|nr:PilZ domain-containing protein [Tepidicella baoligensis]
MENIRLLVILATMFSDNRSSIRETVELPARLADGREGWTKNISATGVLLELDGNSPLDSEVSFEIHLETSVGPLKLVARGQVVRVQPNGNRKGIAVQLVTSRLEPAE